MIPEFQYIENLINFRLNKYFYLESDDRLPSIPELETWHLPLANFIRENQLSKEEAVVLLIGIVPHIIPNLFDKAIERKIGNAGDFPGIGGIRGKNCRFFLPTGETVLFLLTDGDMERRLLVQQFFGPEHLFSTKKIAWLEDMHNGEPPMHGRLIVSQDYIDTFSLGQPIPPHFGISFPARLITTDLTWDDLVLNNELKSQVAELQTWINHNEELMKQWGMEKRLRKGYRTLFYGPPGTGKTLTAGLLGKYTGKQVYKIDLSMIVSKYIGETEKNLELLFARAEDKGWILFFDEADALFGKRTNVRDAHDKYANQEVSYLLQRIEDYDGLIILATNMKNNIDDAFIRRFNSILKFPLPDADERVQIWNKSFPAQSAFVKKIIVKPEDTGQEEEQEVPAAIPELVKKYELTGGNINNVIHYASLKAVERRNAKMIRAVENDSKAQPAPLTVYLQDVLDGIRREMIKEGKPFR